MQYKTMKMMNSLDTPDYEKKNTLIKISYLMYLAKNKHENMEDMPDESMAYVVDLSAYLIDISNNPSDPTYDKELVNEVFDSLNTYEYARIKYPIIKEFYDSITAEELKNIIINSDNHSTQGKMGELQLGSESLYDLSEKILETTKGSTIFNLGSFIGDYLISYALKHDDYKFYGVENSYDQSLISRIRLKVLGVEFNIDNGSYYYKGNGDKYDKVMTTTPIGMRIEPSILERMNDFFNLDSNKGFRRYSMDWVFAYLTSNLVKENGMGVVVITPKGLVNEPEEYVRSQLIKKGLVEAVIQLPSGALGAATSIESAIVVLSHNNKAIKFIDARKKIEKTKYETQLKIDAIYDSYIGANSEDSVSVDIEKVMENKSILSPSRYLVEKNVKFNNSKKLGQIASDVFRGYQLQTSRELKAIAISSPQYKLLKISNIEDAGIIGEMDSIKLDEKRASKYLLQYGDVVLAAKGSAFKAAVVEQYDKHIIATGNIIVIRTNSEYITPQFLCMYLNSPDGLNYLSLVQSGGVIKSVNVKQLKEILVPVPDSDTQNDYGLDYMIAADEIRKARIDLQKYEREIDNVYMEYKESIEV